MQLEDVFEVTNNPKATDALLSGCYEFIFGRRPDPKGWTNYADLIELGISRYDLVSVFVESPEFENRPDDAQKRYIRSAYEKMRLAWAKTHYSVKWFHSMPLPNGIITEGDRPIEVLRREADCVFKPGVEGKSLLEIGAWDGFFSFEAERRGAADVLSTDHFCWSGPGWGSKKGYDFTHHAWGSKARSLDVDVFDLDPEKHGTFDVVLFMGVFYHLKNPYGGLEKAASMTHDLLVVETVTDCNQYDKPVMRHYCDTDLDGDPTNFFAPNTACLASMLSELGFSKIDIVRNPGLLSESLETSDHDRHIVHAWRNGA